MAEIEFKRRGTPLWTVVLALLVVAGIVWALVRRGHAPAPAAADSTAATPADSARRAAAAKVPVPVTAPAAATGPAMQFAAWVDSTKVPDGAEPQRAHIGKGLQLLAGALEERVPFAGAQILMLRAMADTLQLPNLKPAQYLNAAQAGFFAVAYALRNTTAGARINQQAAMLQLTKPLAQQTEQVQSFFAAAGAAMKAPIQPQAVAPSSVAPPKAPLPPPPSPEQAKPTPAPQAKG